VPGSRLRLIGVSTMDTFISELSQDITVALPPWTLSEIAGALLWAWVALPLILGVGLAVARIISWLACMAAKPQ
jgi:hypothetical protein